MGVACIQARTFSRHQSTFLQPAVERVWGLWQEQFNTAALEAATPLVLGGDGRADSPGHSAKFGTYSLMDLKSSQICCVQIVQVGEQRSCMYVVNKVFLF